MYIKHTHTNKFIEGGEVLKRVELLYRISKDQKEEHIEENLTSEFVMMRNYLLNTILPSQAGDFKKLHVRFQNHLFNPNRSKWESDWMWEMWSHLCEAGLS